MKNNSCLAGHKTLPTWLLHSILTKTARLGAFLQSILVPQPAAFFVTRADTVWTESVRKLRPQQSFPVQTPCRRTDTVCQTCMEVFALQATCRSLGSALHPHLAWQKQLAMFTRASFAAACFFIAGPLVAFQPSTRNGYSPWQKRLALAMFERRGLHFTAGPVVAFQPSRAEWPLALAKTARLGNASPTRGEHAFRPGRHNTWPGRVATNATTTAGWPK